jgi:hypothetical protein
MKSKVSGGGFDIECGNGKSTSNYGCGVLFAKIDIYFPL